MPTGVAVGRAGELYVADAAAQRVREVAKDGTVTTLAGSGAIDTSGLWVAGGFRDGPAAVARFNEPRGVAVATDGAILVADRRNHCVRSIQNGTVSTYAGSPTEAGNRDGTRADATFQAPMAVTADRQGNVFVADFGVGPREIDKNGNVTTIALPYGRGLAVTGVSVYQDGATESLLVTLRTGVVRLDLHGGPPLFYAAGGPAAVEPAADSQVYIEAFRSIGYPFGVAAVDGETFAYTDIWTDTIRLIVSHETRVIAGFAREGGPGRDARFADGGVADARFDQPMGIARLPDGAFVVADTGNRRIRRIPAPNPRRQDSVDALRADTSSYRIAYVGNSATNYDSIWPESIAGRVESALRTDWATNGFKKRPRVFNFTLIADDGAIGSFVDTYLTSGLADVVIWQINSGEIASAADVAAGPHLLGANPLPSFTVWGPRLQREIADADRSARASGCTLVIAINPEPWELSPTESAYSGLYDFDAGSFDAYEPVIPTIRRIVDETHVPVLDMSPAFTAEERRANHPALFGTRDFHFSEEGKALAARLIVDELRRIKPWLSR